MFEMAMKVVVLALAVEAVFLGGAIFAYIGTRLMVEQTNLSISKKRIELVDVELKVAEANKALVDVQVAFFEEAEKNNKETIRQITNSMLTSMLTSQLVAGRA